MARVEIPAPADLLIDAQGNVRSGVTVTAKLAGTATNVTHYSALTGGTSTTGGLVTHTDGTVVNGSGARRYVDSGQALDITIAGLTRQVEPFSASVERKVGSYINPKAAPYSAMGNGSTDDTTALALATEDARNTGKLLYVDGSTYKVSDVITTQGNPNKLRLLGDGPGSTEFTMAAGMTNPVIGAIGALAAGATLSSAVAAGDYLVSIPSTSGYTAGDYMLLMDSTQPVYGLSNRSTVAYVSEWVRIRSVNSGTVLALTSGLEYGYTTSATARRMSTRTQFDLEGFSIRNLTPGTLAATARGVSMTYFAGCRIANVGFQDMDAHAINIIRGTDAEIDGIHFLNTRDLETANTPYCIITSSSQNILIRGLRSRYGRHIFTAGGDTTYGIASHIHISDAIASEHSASGFDTHAGTTRTTFENCHVYGSFPSAVYLGSAYETSGFQIRGTDTDLIGCTAQGVPNRGAYFVYGADRGRVIGCRFHDCDVGVGVEDSNDVYIGGGTSIENPVTDGIVTTVGVNFTAYVDTLYLGETLITGNPTGYAVNNAANLNVIYV